MKKLFALGALLVATSAMANFNSNTPTGGFTQGTTTANTISVAQALKAKDKSIVALKGKIQSQLGDDDFLFTDGTSQIKIEVEDNAWNGQQITPNDTILIEGKIDNEVFEKTTLDVFRVTKL